MLQAICQKTKGTKVVKIYHDTSPESPREWSNLGKILYGKRSRYVLGDEAVEAETIEDMQKNPEVIFLPVFAYIHSGVLLNTTGFTCPWDSGQSGIIYADKEQIKKEFGVKEITPDVLEKIYDCFRAEIETFSKYLNGEVYGFQVEEKGEVVDSCWGFYEEPEKLADLVLSGQV